ncbi:MAG: dihydroxy-acid dehydratase, partial [Lachnospiraceae bacterium]|nr:dihydroxy-acid dehydratase [Lachnospiraceae bacterium]
LPWWKEFDEASHTVPLLSHLAPGGPYSLREFDLAGGMPGLMRSLLPALYAEEKNVCGRTLREIYAHAPIYDPEVIRSLENPVSKDPGLGVLFGNLAPEGSILKIAAVPEQLRHFRGKARIFNSLDEGLAALREGRVHPGDACILRFLGLKARFGTTAFPFQEELKGRKELYESCAVITDGRFSGGTSGLSVGYVSPEAALGGPLGLLREGDEIEIDVEKRTISVRIPDEEMAKRKAEFHWEFPFDEYPRFLRLFAKNVGSMAKGGIWE